MSRAQQLLGGRVGRVALVFALALTACSNTRERVLPQRLAELAEIPGIPRARFWGDELPPWFDEHLAVMKQELLDSFTADEMALPSNYLVLSGGGQHGAFGAGFLNGWTDSGQRPPFLIVTGVSTGALIAPFAFAGPEYDDELHALYTTLSTRDVATERSLLGMAFGDSLADSAPLRRLIEEHVDEDLLRAIVHKSREGRRLYVGTTNLDAERPVIWDLTAIARSGAPGALTLIHDVLLASASLPAIFPPVTIEVDVHGERFTEMHVDGGATAQLFLYPAKLDWRSAAEELELDGTHRLYILRNSFLHPRWEEVEPSLGAIAQRAVHSLVRTHGRGDLYRLYLGALRDGIRYHLAFIPQEFALSPDEQFDQHYMRALYEVGYRQATGGYAWAHEPPGFEDAWWHAPLQEAAAGVDG